ncbi:MAG: polysaccharide biosynthesis protein [Oscillospiraceae bacterium]|nr:polysaccharide biosynthesis protein [Oscillospiraceae bacterium]
MSDPSKKQTFLHGAALLALATAVVKVIGALYKIPLQRIIGDDGFGYFTTAYDIYSVLLMISTAGLPIAMSKMISQYHALGHYNQVRQVYKTSRNIFLILGLGSTLVMMVLCQWLAAKLNTPDAWFSILCLAPCALLMGFMSTYRGFFQGQENMRPTSNSQMLEAAFKLIVGLAAAFLIMRITGSVPMAAGGAILGVTISCLVSTLYLYGKFRPAYRELPHSGDAAFGYRQTAKALLAIAIPITIGSAGLQLLTVVESGLYMDQIVELIDTDRYALPLIETLKTEVLANPEISPDKVPYQVAANLKGIYSFCLTIFNMPCAFIIPITASVLPAITSALTLKNHQGVRETEESAARITGLLSLPCAVGLTILARPVMALVGGYTGQRLDLAAQLMALLGISIFLYAIIQYTNVVLQSHGKVHIPVINMLLSGGAKLAVVYVLSGNPAIGILGTPIGTLLCYLCIAVLNLICISRAVPQKPALIRNLLRPLLPAAIMGVVVFLCQWAMTDLLQISSRVLLCGVPIAVGGVVYLLLVVLCKAITREDCLLLPKGEKLAKLLKL